MNLKISINKDVRKNEQKEKKNFFPPKITLQTFYFPSEKNTERDKERETIKKK